MKRTALIAVATIVFALTSTAAPPGWLGLGYVLHSGAHPWLEVVRLIAGGPAERAGLRPRDVITAIDGKPLAFRNDDEALRFFAVLRPGTRVRFHVRRGTATVELAAVAEKAPAAAPQYWERNRDLARRAQQQRP
jgi:C-terminal processing protease CtpA/Prc